MDDFDLIWLRTISEDTKMIAYRPAFRQIAGSVTAAILLQQILYRWTHNGFEPFYKYKEPCDAADYRKGDSWCEELAFSREEFDGAIKRIGQKMTIEKGKDPNALVWYRVMGDRKTWYEVNYVTLRNGCFPLYAKRETPVTQSGKPALPILYTKNTSKVTTKNESDNDRAIATGSSRSHGLSPIEKTETIPDQPSNKTAFVVSDQALPMRSEQRSRKTDAAYNTICTAIENNGFGLMTPILSSKVNTLMDTYPADWIIRAMETAVSSNKLRLDYVEGILKNWKVEGFSYDNRRHHSERGGQGVHPTTEQPADARDTHRQRQRAYNDRYVGLMADEINNVISAAEAAKQWQELEQEFPNFIYTEV